MKDIRVDEISSHLRRSPASHRGRPVIIVVVGGGETDGGNPVTEGHRAGQLENGKVICTETSNEVWMLEDFAEKIIV